MMHRVYTSCLLQEEQQLLANERWFERQSACQAPGLGATDLVASHRAWFQYSVRPWRVVRRVRQGFGEEFQKVI